MAKIEGNIYRVTRFQIYDAEGNLRSGEFPRTIEFVPQADNLTSPVDVEEALIGSFEITAKPDLIVRDGNRTAYVQIGDGLKDYED